MTTVDVMEESVEPILAAAPDAVFLALHGAFGEDGRIQAALNEACVPYTGSGPMSSRLAMDKELSKAVCMTHGIPTAPFAVFDEPRAEAVVANFVKRHGYPVVLKPAYEGSSLGVSIADNAVQAAAGAAEALRYGNRALVEAFIHGRELCVTVCDGEPWPLVEVRPAGRFYDFAAKYNPQSGTEYTLHPPIGEGLTRICEQLGVATYHALGCRGLARVDLLLSSTAGPQVLEVNTIPGMTPTSLAPKAAQAAGFEFGALCEKLVRSAVRETKYRLRRVA